MHELLSREDSPYDMKVRGLTRKIARKGACHNKRCRVQSMH